MPTTVERDPFIAGTRLKFSCGCWVEVSDSFIEANPLGIGEDADSLRLFGNAVEARHHELYGLAEHGSSLTVVFRRVLGEDGKPSDTWDVVKYAEPASKKVMGELLAADAKKDVEFRLLLKRLRDDDAGAPRVCGLCGKEFPRDVTITVLLDGTVRCPECRQHP